jgi:hypothetical protein
MSRGFGLRPDTGAALLFDTRVGGRLRFWPEGREFDASSACASKRSRHAPTEMSDAPSIGIEVMQGEASRDAHMVASRFDASLTDERLAHRKLCGSRRRR